MKREREDDTPHLSPIIDSLPHATRLGKRPSSDFDMLSDNPPTNSTTTKPLSQSSSSIVTPSGSPTLAVVAPEDVKPTKVVYPASPPLPMEGEFTEEPQTTVRPRGKKPNTIVRTSQIRFKGKGQADQTRVRLKLSHELTEATVGWYVVQSSSFSQSWQSLTKYLDISLPSGAKMNIMLGVGSSSSGVVRRRRTSSCPSSQSSLANS